MCGSATGHDTVGFGAGNPDVSSPYNELLLSELGDHLLGGERGLAGVKRIASLLHSTRWKSELILRYLWERANEKIKELVSGQVAAYVVWNESVLEKNESLRAEGFVLCAPAKQHD